MNNTQLNASSRIMLEEAERRGIHCTTFGDHETILMQQKQQQWYIRGSRTSFQSSVGKTIADYKPLTKKILSHFQLPTAKWVVLPAKSEIDSVSEAQLRQLQFPVVLKPLDQRHGQGVIVGVRTFEELQTKYTPGTSVLIEEQLQGNEYRVVCIDYHFVAAAYRKPAHVVGDGEHTLTELIAQKNAHPWRGVGHQNNLTVITIDELVTQLLVDQGYALTDIPELGKEILLRKTANLSTGGEAWNVSDQVSEQNKILFEQIARACDLNVIGIDVMCADISSPIVDQQSAGVIEVNASPGLRMHHFPLKGEPINIAGLILDLCLRSIK